MAAQSGQSCPPHYRYSPRAFRTAPTESAEIVYVIGGLYGNAHALRAILRMRDAERRAGREVALVFNGDYNWFNIDVESFRYVNDVALASIAIQGNVEAELAGPSGTGCGCNYPDYVNAEYVDRSNAIMARLQRAAADFPDTRARLAALPLFRVLEIGGERIGVVHGDAESLAGWAFAAERLTAVGVCSSGDRSAGPLTPIAKIASFFRAADVRAFACTHTCLPHARDYRVDATDRLIINNGAAGMANFSGMHYGVITRIAVDPAVPATSLYGIRIGNVRFDALPLDYDQAAWLSAFCANWPPGSPAYESYFGRISNGPDFTLGDAIGGNVALARH